MYIKHKEIKYVEFKRIGNASSGTGRSFDISIYKIEADGPVEETFKNIDKKELKALMNYFKNAGIKMRQTDPDTNKAVDLEDMNSEELDEEIRQSQAVDENKKSKDAGEAEAPTGRGGRRRVPVAQPQMVELDDDDYDEEDDESFGDEGTSGDDDEEGEAEMSDEIDDEEIDKGELANLKGNKTFEKTEKRKKK